MGVWLWLRVREPVRLRLPLCVGDPVGLLERVADGDAGTKIERTRSLAVSATRANVPAALSVIPLGWLNDAADPTPSVLPA